MALQETISTARLARHVGTIRQVLVDEVTAHGALARTSSDAPEIDGVVHVSAAPTLLVGEFANVLIEKSDTHDLWGRVVK
jgi:ribosomal protein S12 methylthiotransferase